MTPVIAAISSVAVGVESDLAACVSPLSLCLSPNIIIGLFFFFFFFFFPKAAYQVSNM